jgi:hypothetical protein
VLHFTRAETDRELQEIATDIRLITEMPLVSVDPAQRTLTLHGTGAQIALAEWLFNQWESSTPAATQEYRLSSDDIVAVFHLVHTPTVQSLQGVATDVRTMANLRRLFTYNAPRVISARGGASQIAVAEWLVSQLDQPASQAARSGVHEYRPSGTADDVVRVFYPANAGTPEGLQEMATDIRTIANIRLFFIYTGTSALIARGTAAEMAFAEWLVNELGQPTQTPAPHEYRPSGTVDDVVRVFFLTHAESPQRLQQIATEVRSTTEVKRISTYTTPRAMTVRGTAAQIAMADKMIAERDR